MRKTFSCLLSTIKRFFIALMLCVAIITLAIDAVYATTQLPIQSSQEFPSLLLELGKDPSLEGINNKTTKVVYGELLPPDKDSSIQTDKDEISSLHSDFGTWKVGFRFTIKAGISGYPYLFWARWRQGGDPNVCIQTFEIWAGSEASKLELRASLQMKPKGWDYSWIASETPVNFKTSDVFVEIRNSGSGHDAKVFDAFLLAPPFSNMPTKSTAKNPVVLLDLGSAPLLASLEKDPDLQISRGKTIPGKNTKSVLTEKDEVQVFHEGFGDWAAKFNFNLSPTIKPGQYRFFARYKSGGEVSQVTQNFIVNAGIKLEEMANRGNFILTNKTPWEYQWLQAEGYVTILPGDSWLEVLNTGKAEGAKVFDAFLLKFESPLDIEMSSAQVQLRNQFLAMTKVDQSAKNQLYILDGNDAGSDTLFSGLASNNTKSSYEKMSVHYMAGSDSMTLARNLNISTLPSALITDDHYSVLGVLTQPKNVVEVAKFLTDPTKFGTMLPPRPFAQESPKSLNKGVPEAWLVGGLQDGLAGVSLFGLENETSLRPNPDQTYLSMQMMGGEMRTWDIAPTQSDGSTDVEKNTNHSFSWSRGTGYAHLYLYVETATKPLLHLNQSGIRTAVWLDGKPITLNDDHISPSGFSHSATPKLSDTSHPPQVAILDLAPGWHSLLVKLVMKHEQNQRFYFSSLFTDSYGKPLDYIKTQLSDPIADLALNNIANKIRPLLFVDAPANLPHPGDSLKLRVNMRWHSILEETKLATPLLGFNAKLRLRLVDFNGNKIGDKEINGFFPGEVDIDFGKAGEAGYYAIYPSLHTSDGKLIMNYPADGFTVVRGNSEQKKRLDKKKLWNNNYYALADGDKSFMQKDAFFSWLERMGIYKNVGSYPGFELQYQAKWDLAKELGLLLFADSSGDSNWLNDNPKDGEMFVNTAAKFTPYFKATNELDIRSEPQWQKLRDPEHWVQRAKWEFEHIHKRRKDAHYVGASLVRPGGDNEAGHWFKKVLELGLDKYQDAWDIHAYPQKAPSFGGAIGNGENEDERGVLATYASLGKKNILPFWLGETGAKAMHGLTGRRWQAEQVAKMIAWVNSRRDYLGLAFCIGHEYDLAYGRLWDYSMGHKPGEAAMYTASALIDGLPYHAIDTKNATIQAAYFGETFMIWRSDENTENWQLYLSPNTSWVFVDVVGKVQNLPVNADGNANITISSSPVYVLSRSDYERLTR